MTGAKSRRKGHRYELDVVHYLQKACHSFWRVTDEGEVICKPSCRASEPGNYPDAHSAGLERMQKCVEKEAKEQGGQLVALLATPGEEYRG